MEGAEESKGKEVPPSSSSSCKNNNKQERKHDVASLKIDKKMKLESQTEPAEQFTIDESSINDLPPEMLMKILKNLDPKNLSACRLVNRKWNEISIETIKFRDDVEIQIDCSGKGKKFKSKWKTGKRRRSFVNFINCFGQSKSFPFTRFLCQVDNSTFEEDDWMKFLSDFGENIKCLKLEINPISKDEDLIKLTKNLHNLLLNQLSNLQEFGLFLYDCNTPNSSPIQLFPNPNPATLAVQLPHLKTIYIGEESLTNQTGIVVDLLQAAVNLKKLDSFSHPGIQLSMEELYHLQSLGKLHCVQDIEMELCHDFLFEQFKIQQKSQASLVFQLEKLSLYTTPVYKDQSIWSTAASFLSNLFETSKDTVKELDTDAFGFLHELQLPRFTNLTKLCVETGGHEPKIQEPIIPFGIKLQNTFPVLNSLALEIPWTTAFPPGECNSIIPALETLKISKTGFDKKSIEQISSMCPNLKHLDISNYNGEGRLRNFPDVGTAIWAHLKKLQSLKLQIAVGTLNNKFPAIDSCITGISKEDSERLYDLVQAEKVLTKWNLQGRISQSELKAERKNVSILDLKDLKILTIGVVWFYDADDVPSEDLTKKALTFVSEDYALKLMDNLNYKINRQIERV